MEPTRSEARIVNPRLYRLGFIPAIAALVIAMFSLAGTPDPIEPVTPTGTFDGERAATTARQIVRASPEREPGTPGDREIADLAKERFAAIPAGAVTEQPFEVDVDGEATALQNVILTLPGDAARTTLVIADRNGGEGEGAASSAAATAVLLELAEALGVAGHESTYVLASTAGGVAGAEVLLENLPERETVETVIVVSQPGAAEPRPPYAVTSSTSTRTGPVQLRRTAEDVIEAQTGRPSPGESAFRELARLAFPSGLGPQAPLIADGFDAVTVSSAGERPLVAAEDGPDDLSAETIDSFGRAVHQLVNAVDISGSLEHGPSTYIELGANLVPGWTLSLLALTLLVPVGLTAFDATARVARRGELPRSFAWAAARSLPFIGGLALLYGFATVGLIPKPRFPFDPGLHEGGTRAIVAFALIVIGTLASALLLRRFGVTGSRAPLGSLAAVGCAAALGGLVLWLVNPYLALLAIPAAHVWVLADAPATRVRAVVVTVLALLACVPVLSALGTVSSALDLGSDAPWTITLMIADGQIPLSAMVAAAFTAGSLAVAAALAIGGGGRLPAQPGAGR